MPARGVFEVSCKYQHHRSRQLTLKSHIPSVWASYWSSMLPWPGSWMEIKLIWFLIYIYINLHCVESRIAHHGANRGPEKSIKQDMVTATQPHKIIYILKIMPRAKEQLKNIVNTTKLWIDANHCTSFQQVSFAILRRYSVWFSWYTSITTIRIQLQAGILEDTDKVFLKVRIPVRDCERVCMHARHLSGMRSVLPDGIQLSEPTCSNRRISG